MMDEKGLLFKLRSNLKLVAVIVVCLIVVASVGAVLVLWGSAPEEEEYVLKADISTDKTRTYVYEEVTFSANGSLGDIVAYLWDLGEGDIVRDISVTRMFPTSRHYNVYLTITDSKGEQDIAMVNISVFNTNDETETTGAFLDSSARRGPSYDYADLNVYGGLTRPTLYINWTGVTECALIHVSAWIPGDYYSETIVCAGEGLEVRLVFEDLELDEMSWADMYIECERGYITDYCLQMAVVY